MIRFRKSLFSLGGMAVAAGALVFIGPRTAQGIAAALVQVTNTVASPAVTQEVGNQAGQFQYLHCTANSETSGNVCSGYVKASNELFPGYTVPAGQTLVITALDITPGGNTAACGGTNFETVTLVPLSGTVVSVNVTGMGTTHFTYASGPVVYSGSELTLSDTPTGNCPVDVGVYGYLTSN